MRRIFQKYIIKWTEIGKEEYPQQLASITRAPNYLYYRGNIKVINQRHNIAVIGSRQVSERGAKIAYQIGYELGKKNINVVNGLALGCDTHAFYGALAAGGTCVAVMPCGLDHIVPYSNCDLAKRLLLNGGCLVSEYFPSVPIQKYQYVERDRLQSGISGGVLVIEASYDSGTMHTVRGAIKQGRRLACVASHLVQCSSGNEWIEGLNEACVICDRAGLDRFIETIHKNITYRQIIFETE
ncbi:MAG: DNA-protecting protein DprA [Lachnospiraceae bacterium]